MLGIMLARSAVPVGFFSFSLAITVYASVLDLSECLRYGNLNTLDEALDDG